MSDYIKRQDVIDIIHKEIENTKSYIEHNTQINIKFAVEELPTLDEKEIIRKPFERVVKRICDVRNNTPSTDFKNGCNASLHQIHREIDIDVKECGINE